jgi:hypothetical protein
MKLRNVDYKIICREICREEPLGERFAHRKTILREILKVWTWAVLKVWTWAVLKQLRRGAMVDVI